ncbi:helix-turn-helix domain-containing protein [Paracoccus methylarcula]|uniref:helix-turn-helix domain-containing protein n=1 Tax=Paracoccus methylarcula TaxID=72022 RepID=UPI001FE6C709|nr:helix-turn-helix domain-containing protein [Paracoccus methylarcula]
MKFELDPAEDYRPERLTEAELSLRRDAIGKFLHLATPQLDQVFKLVGLPGRNVLLSDADGVVVDQRIHTADTRQFQEWDLWPGANWSEAVQGTNGIGTCLVEGRQICIHREEHFRTRNIDMSCMVAPIWGPDGRLLAALDVTSARDDQDEHSNSLILSHVANVARTIEAMNFRACYPDARIIFASKDGSDPAMLLAVDRDDLVIGATLTARRALGLEREGDITHVPAADLLESDADLAEQGFYSAERVVLTRALARAGGNVSAAARLLGIGRTTMYRRMARAGLG